MISITTLIQQSYHIIKACQRRALEGGQTTEKANIYLGDVWTSQPEQVSTLSP